ncbi:MAG: pre-peptidase C-terminal domain-containing protein, partial [Thermoguttaceae bacterium]|nr:pre-peptidase C-terminal domain-containing protein [Thermoguttaceae bacterium]
VVFNGQIRPGDIDRFYFRARKHQRLTLDVQARSLEPFIANAVPGWFAATISLYDPDGQKIRVSESYRFDQNPLMLVKTQKTGIYCVEIQDSIFRGRNDFVYRISVGPFPLVHSFFPIGGAAGKPLEISLFGGNLPQDKINVDTSGNVYYEDFRTISLLNEKEPLIRPFHYVVETLPVFYEPPRPDDQQIPTPRVYSKEDCRFSWLPHKERPSETQSVEPSASDQAPQEAKVSPVAVAFPCVVYGKIEQPCEVDFYQFQAKPGQKVVVDIAAQRLGSALDAVVELVDPAGNVIADSDDRSDASGPNIGTSTHDADPHLESEIMMNGVHAVRVFGRTRHSGADCFYRLRISPPQGDFRVVTVGSVARVNGQNTSIKVRAFRSEGFEGPIKLRPAGNDDNFVLASGGQIQAGESEKSFGIHLIKKLDPNPTPLDLEAVATVDGKEIVRPVLAADDWEQAFIYHHLVPSTHLYLAQGGKVPPEIIKENERRKKEAERRKKIEEEKKLAAEAAGEMPGKPGDAKPGDTKPGNAKSGDAKTGTGKPDSSRSSTNKKDASKDANKKDSRSGSDTRSRSKYNSRMDSKKDGKSDSKDSLRDRRDKDNDNDKKENKSGRYSRYKTRADSMNEDSRSTQPGNRSNRRRR